MVLEKELSWKNAESLITEIVRKRYVFEMKECLKTWSKAWNIIAWPSTCL